VRDAAVADVREDAAVADVRDMLVAYQSESGVHLDGAIWIITASRGG
jgi:hypothetical protein